MGDELGFSLLQLSGGSAGAGAGPGSAGAVTGTSTPARSNGGSSPTLGAQLLSMPSGPPVVLSAVLGVFEALMHVTGPALRILVEGFARQVYLRALVQVYSLFKDQVPCHRPVLLNDRGAVVTYASLLVNAAGSVFGRRLGVSMSHGEDNRGGSQGQRLRLRHIVVALRRRVPAGRAGVHPRELFGPAVRSVPPGFLVCLLRLRPCECRPRTAAGRVHLSGSMVSAFSASFHTSRQSQSAYFAVASLMQSGVDVLHRIQQRILQGDRNAGRAAVQTYIQNAVPAL